MVQLTETGLVGKGEGLQHPIFDLTMHCFRMYIHIITHVEVTSNVRSLLI